MPSLLTRIASLNARSSGCQTREHCLGHYIRRTGGHRPTPITSLALDWRHDAMSWHFQASGGAAWLCSPSSCSPLGGRSRRDGQITGVKAGSKVSTTIAEVMSAKFGVTFTKNSMIGKARRLGIPPRKIIEMENRAIKADVPRPKKGMPVTIYQLREGRCKWPYGTNPPYLFCGKATGEIGCSWCATHRKRVFGRSTYGT